MLPRFLFCENKSALPGAGLILCTEVPFFYAQVIKGVGIDGITSYAQNHKAIAAGKPLNYSIGIIVMGALHSSLYIEDTTQYAKDLARIAREMSDFYLEEKIKHSLKYYERYKDKEL